MTNKPKLQFNRKQTPAKFWDVLHLFFLCHTNIHNRQIEVDEANLLTKCEQVEAE